MATSPEPSPPADVAPPTPRRRRGLRLAAWIAGGLAALVGLFAVLGFWAAPRIIRSQVIAQIEKKYHRQATLGDVRVNPFKLRLEADRFGLPDADGKPMIGFDRLKVGVSLASIWRGGVVFSEIAVDGPRVRLVRRPDGRLNLQDLVPPPDNKPPAKIIIDHLAVSQGHAEVTDLDRRTPFTKTFAPISFVLNDFSTVKDGAAYVLNAVSERGEGLAWRGTFGLAPLASQGSFSLSRIKVRPLWELAGDEAPFGITDGQLDLAGTYRFASKGEALTLGIEVGDLRLTNAALRARGADADWVVLPVVDVAQIHVDVPGRAVSVGRIEATAPAVTAWTEAGGGINLARYAGPPAAKSAARAPTPATSAPAGPAWKVDLPDLRLRGARIAFEDRAGATPVKLTATPLDVSVTGLALPLAKPVQVEASTGLEGGGRLSAKGAVALDKVSADLEVEAADVDLPRFQPYIDGAASLKLLSGRFSGKGHTTYAAKDGARFDGALRVDGLHTVDKLLEQDFVNWRSLRFEGVSARTQPFAVKVREVVAQEPYARVVIGPNYVMNVMTVLNPKGAVPQPVTPPPLVTKAKFSLFSKPKPKPAPPPQPKATPKAALPVEIDLVRVENGRMDFADMTVEPRFAAGIEALNGTIKGLSGRQDARADVDLTGQVDRYAPVKIDGKINYFAARSFTDIKMSFQNMELTTFSPYSGKFAGYRINKGKLNVDLHYNIDDQKLDANHRVVINQLELGDRVDSADAVKLPVKLIVALLKNRDGVIDIPIAIQGTLDDPKFKVWPVIWKVVGNLLVKIATSPFALLGALGGHGEELQYIDFAPGAVVLDDAGREKVAALAKALAERPALNLEIPMPVSPAVDRPVLVEARFKAELATAAAERLGKRADKAGAVDAALGDPKSRRGILEALYRRQFGAKPDIPKPEAAKDGPKPDADKAACAWLEEKLRAKVAVGDEDLRQLGRARAEAVQSVLLGEGQIAPARVFVTAQPPLEASTAPVRMTLSLS